MTMPLRLGVISHLLEHFRDVEEAKLAGIVLLQRMQLARCYLVALDSVRLSEIGAQVFNEAARDRGRQFNRFRHVADIVDLTSYCESGGSADNPAASQSQSPGRAPRWIRLGSGYCIALRGFLCPLGCSVSAATGAVGNGLNVCFSHSSRMTEGRYPFWSSPLKKIE
jgi:hypothetical protein